MDETKSKMPAEVHGTLSAIREEYEQVILELFVMEKELSPTIATKLEQAHIEIAKGYPPMVIHSVEEETLLNYYRDVDLLDEEARDIIENAIPGSREWKALSEKAGRSAGHWSRERSESERKQEIRSKEMTREREEAVAQTKADGNELLAKFVKKTMEAEEAGDEPDSRSGCSHNEDFSAVVWHHKEFSLPRKPALMIKALWKAMEDGEPGLRWSTLREVATIRKGVDFQDYFKHIDCWRDLVEYDKRLRLWRLKECG